MKNIKEQILSYNGLSVEERREVDAYVEAHPELRPLLEDAKAFDALLHDARQLYTDPPSDEALAYYLVSRYLDRHPLPASLRAAFERIDAKVQEDPELAGRLQRLEQRLLELESRSDPKAHFERLTGHRLDVPPDPVPSQPIKLTVRNVGSQPAGERPARARRLYGRAMRWATAAVFVLGVSYGALFAISEASQSDVDRLAAFDAEALFLEGYEVRTRGSNAADASDLLFLEALRSLRDARQTTLGLFPHFDQARLRTAGALLEQLVAQEEGDSFLQLEAYFLLGKVYLATRDVPAAQAALQRVVDGQGRNAPEAARILSVLGDRENVVPE